MAKMFYSLAEALAKLGCEESALRSAVRDGKLREFRDAGNVNYKVDEVDKLAASGVLGGSKASEKSVAPVGQGDTDNPAPDLSASGSIGLMDSGAVLGGSGTGGSAAGKSSSGSGGLSLDAMDASGIDLAASAGGDIVSLEDDESASSAAGDTADTKKDDTVVTSVGVSVFDEEDLDQSADPMAKTIMSGTGAGGIGLEGVGSGSGLLDLTRESDDTSLGAEFLEEIYPTEEGGARDAGTLEMGEDTRAGLEMALPEEKEAVSTEAAEPAAAAADREAAPAAAEAVAVRIDPLAQSASGLMAVALAVMCFAGLAMAAMIRGTWPSILDFVYGKLWMFGVGAVVVAGVVMLVSVFLGKRSRT